MYGANNQGRAQSTSLHEKRTKDKTLPPRAWRTVAFLGAHLVLLVLSLALMLGQLYPPNRGDLTVAEFSENFNYYCSYYSFDVNGHTMATDGSWCEKAWDGSVTIYILEESPMPTFTFLCDEAGVIQEVQISAQAENREFTAPNYQNYQLIGGLAALGAQSKFPTLTFRQYAKALEAAPNQSMEFSAVGVALSWDITQEGYVWSNYLDQFYIEDPELGNSYALRGVITLPS